MIDLDTNFLIDALVPGSFQEAQLVAWLSTGETIGLCAVAWGEFLCGPLSAAAEALARQLLPTVTVLARSEAERAAEFFNLSGRRSKSFADCCIAACAMKAGARLATSNRDDFAPLLVHGLKLA